MKVNQTTDDLLPDNPFLIISQSGRSSDHIVQPSTFAVFQEQPIKIEVEVTKFSWEPTGA